MQPKDASIRKRSQIAKANRVMFAWVAAVSVVVGFCLVGAIFLTQRLIFNEKVQTVKDQTVANLKVDNDNVSALEANVRVLNDNEALSSVKANPSDQAIQVILDALPSDANSLALGASLQDKLLAGISGITLQSLKVDPVVGVEQLSTDTSVDDTSSDGQPVVPDEITFNFSVTGSQAALKQVLQQLERSIRVIDVTNLEIASQGSVELMTVEGHAYYQPAEVVQLQTEVVRP